MPMGLRDLFTRKQQAPTGRATTSEDQVGAASLKPGAEDPFLMQVEDAFPITGRGMAAVGPVVRGALSKGQDVEVLGSGASLVTKASGADPLGGGRNAERFLDKVVAGNNASLTLQNLSRDQVKPGDVLVTPGTMATATSFYANTQLLSVAEGGVQWIEGQSVSAKVFMWGSYLQATVTVSSEKWEAPHQQCLLEFENLVPVEIGIEFGIVVDDRTVGMGAVADF
jgi:translation elongation factor EF-Tu-like GTPase